MISQKQKRAVINKAPKKMAKGRRAQENEDACGGQLEWDFGGEAADGGKERRELFPEREKAIEELKRRFDLPIDSIVRVTIKGIPGEFTGKLTLDTLLFPDKAKEAIPMRIGRVQFDLRDIESCLRI